MSQDNKKPPKVNQSDYLGVAAYESWLGTIVGKNFYDSDFYRIVDFFVLHSPCSGSSYSPKTLESLGWKNHWQSSQFRKAFDEIAGLIENDNFKHHESKNHFLELWEQLGRKVFFDVGGGEFAIIIRAGKAIRVWIYSIEYVTLWHMEGFQ